MNAGYVELIAGTGMITTCDLWGTIDENLHAHSEELGNGLKGLVQALTPIRTGALVMDITVESYPDPGGGDLVYVYEEDIAQEAFWNRIYVLYQEGGMLGLPTYTNDPHQMFLDTAKGDGLALTEVWALTYVTEAEAMCLGGAGVPFVP
jgi:hypothetical protein